MHDTRSDHEYTEDFITALQWMWGDGYLSPGGPEEVAALLQDVDLTGRRVLDIGCGLGAIDALLVQSYGAGRVVGIDVEPALITHAEKRASAAGISDRVQFRLVQPGPLPFADLSFDVVFSKDSIIHIEDKNALYEDVLRVLKPGGLFVGSDWLCGGDGEYSTEMKAWLDVVSLTFEMKNLAQTKQALQQSGFIHVVLKDRNAWYKKEIKSELATLAGERYRGLARLIGGRQSRTSTAQQHLKTKSDRTGRTAANPLRRAQTGPRLTAPNTVQNRVYCDHRSSPGPVPFLVSCRMTWLLRLVMPGALFNRVSVKLW